MVVALFANFYPYECWISAIRKYRCSCRERAGSRMRFGDHDSGGQLRHRISVTGVINQCHHDEHSAPIDRT